MAYNQGYGNNGYGNNGYLNNDPNFNQTNQKMNLNQPPQYGAPQYNSNQTGMPPQGMHVQYGQPGYGQVPPQQGGQTIVVNNGRQNYGNQNLLKEYQSYCITCQRVTGNNFRYYAGCKTFGICILLLFFTGCCCWIPFVVQDCQDREEICNQCSTIKKVA